MASQIIAAIVFLGAVGIVTYLYARKHLSK